MKPATIRRRAFIGTLLAAASVRAAEAPSFKAAIIGHTGAGNYGHGLENIFNSFPNVKVVGLADPNEAGRERVRQRLKIENAYADFDEMLAIERPNLVSVAPRFSEGHFEMVRTALTRGAHVYCEKPFTVSVDEADKLLAIARRKNLKIAVAHQMRLAPNVQKLREAIAGGLIGDLVQMISYGKQDARAGGEDMIVLGTHIFDMMRHFAGDARRCSATVWNKGALATRDNRRNATENIGPVLGDEIEAQFEFDRGVTAAFTSRGRLKQAIGRWRIDFIGTKGSARILMDIDPDVQIFENGAWKEFAGVPPAEKGQDAANRRLVKDWLAAIAENREAACSGRDGAKSLEMALAVYESHLSARRVELPLSSGAHPLGG